MTPTNFDNNTNRSMIEALEHAQTRDQPFMATGNNDTPVVVGDVNNIDAESDYVAKFVYPKNFAIQGDYTDTDEGREVVRVFKGVSITPRKARRVRHAVTTLILYFSKVNTNTGEQEIMSLSEVTEVYSKLTDEVVDAMETLVQVGLGISDFDMEYLTDESLVVLSSQLIDKNSGFFQ